MDRARPKVLLLGDSEHREFSDAVAWLRTHTDLHVVGSIDEAFETSDENWHTLIFAQSRPGRVAAKDIDRASRAFPLAHCVALLGSLCEGETRSGSPWPGVVRVYWYQFLSCCRSELQLSVEPTSWQLPRTASEIERTERLLRQPPESTTGLVVIFTRDAVLFDSLSYACQTTGYSTVWCSNERRRNHQGAVAAIWDGVTQGCIDFAQLERVSTQLSGRPVIALLAFPRYDQVQRAKANGAQTVISCPFMLPDLWSALGETSRC